MTTIAELLLGLLVAVLASILLLVALVSSVEVQRPVDCRPKAGIPEVMLA